MMKRYIAYALFLIGGLAVLLWAYSRFIQPILPTNINDSLILLFGSFFIVISVIAAFKDVVELIHSFSPGSKMNLIQEHTLGNIIRLLQELQKDNRTEISHQINERFFLNFIQPIWNSFQEIHNDYLKSFIEYEKLLPMDFRDHDLLGRAKKMRILFERIKDDDLRAMDKRVSISEMIRHLPSKQVEAREKYLIDFINAIQEYFSYQSLVNQSGYLRFEPYLYHSRTILVDVLSGKPIDDPLLGQYLSSDKKIIEFFKIESLRRFAEASEKYYSLRKEILISS